MAAAAIIDVKDKTLPKTAKGASNKEREALAQQQHPELDGGEIAHG